MAQITSAPPTEVSQPLQQVLNVWNRIRVNSPIYDFLLRDVDIYHAEEGTFTARIQVASKHLNSKGGLHGVFSACVTDWAGGLAIASCGLESTGVSTNINVSYLSSAAAGDWLEIQGHANKVGRNLAFTTIAISKCTSSGETTLVAQGSHTKYLARR
ncbi:Putative Thioesterase family protein [Aspergillus calidoustus]|jgi:acyl-coenzyme A thioesterase 13|uniref:Putative Thioesterase family protein n=1 Tax=Aspergillus calidoustus TaxID=454130 RepID=A0A0U5FSN1_ASPCI|nr:Putative Thioesterase family protein [Aspergillus calidoustus]